MKVPQGASTSMEGVCDLKAMIADMGKDKSELRGMTKGPDAAVGGKPVGDPGEEEAGRRNAHHVCAPRRVRRMCSRSSGTGRRRARDADFSDYNKPVKAVAPPPDQVVDVDSLGSAAAGALVGHNRVRLPLRYRRGGLTR